MYETFNNNQRLVIFDNTLEYLEERPSTLMSTLTYLSTFGSFHLWYFMQYPLEYWGPLACLSTIGWMTLGLQIRGAKNDIA